MDDSNSQDESLFSELRNLGANLSRMIYTAWENPERKRVQNEILTSLADAGNVVKNEAQSFAESSTAQRLKADVQQISERLRTAEAQTRVRQEMLNILKTANSELEKVIERWAAAEASSTGEAAQSGEAAPADNRAEG